MNELIKMENNIPLLNPQISERIADFEREIKLLKDAEDKLKQAILEEMEQKGIVKIETEDMTITYIAPTDREKFDSKQFRSEHAELYDEYVSMTPVKSSIRIKLKG